MIFVALWDFDFTWHMEMKIFFLSFCHTSYPTKNFNPCEVQRIMPLWKGFMPSSPQMSMWCHTYWHCKRRTSKFLKMSSMLVCSLHKFVCLFVCCANYKTFAQHKVLLGSISQMLPYFHFNFDLCNVEFLKFPHNKFFILIIVVQIGEYFAHTMCLWEAFDKYYSSFIPISFFYHESDVEKSFLTSTKNKNNKRFLLLSSG